MSPKPRGQEYLVNCGYEFSQTKELMERLGCSTHSQKIILNISFPKIQQGGVII